MMRKLTCLFLLLCGFLPVSAQKEAQTKSQTDVQSEALLVDGTAAVTTINDDADSTTVHLSATGSVTEGGNIVYTATLDRVSTAGAVTVTATSCQACLR